jgi:uncharacterized protein
MTGTEAPIETTVETAIATPCTRVCVVHPTLKLCLGCGRSIDEIAGWIGYNAAERAQIMAQLPARLARLNGADAAPTGA